MFEDNLKILLNLYYKNIFFYIYYSWLSGIRMLIDTYMLSSISYLQSEDMTAPHSSIDCFFMC